MRIERLTENKVKVTLTGDDLTSFDINVKKLSGNSTELHSFLFKIMETIHEETGFNPYSGQIVIEAQSVGDGITIIISKIEQGIGKTVEKTQNGRRIRARIREERKGCNTYYFDSFEDLCSAVQHIDSEVHQYGAVYKLGKSYCYLLNFEGEALQNRELLYNTVSVLAEFSERSSIFPMQYLHVREHGTLIAEGEELISMADGLRKINKV